MTAYRLVLWDVDHTLIASGGVGSEISRAAFLKVTGVRQVHNPDVAGRTERAILAESCRLHGLKPEDYAFEDYADALAEGYLSRSAELRERGHALAGAAAALDVLAKVDGLQQTVVSGNVRRVAEVKLTVFGLGRHIDFCLGGYAEDSDIRADLVRLAHERATTAVGTDYDMGRVLVIGDTPADVQAARSAGAAALGVATGKSSRAELLAAGADVSVDDLTDTDALVALVVGEDLAN